MRKFSFNKKILFIFLGLSLYLGLFSGAWGQHETIPCAACHNKTEEELQQYHHDSSSFPVSDVCLSCHDAGQDVSGLKPPHVINGRVELAGGSFTPTLFSDKVGHNILSVDIKLGLTPPGGASLSQFGCLTCHVGHENGNFRRLKKEINGYPTMVEAEGDPEFQQNVYISGMNDFCGACHVKFNGAGNSSGVRGRRRHPVGITIAGAQHADFEHWSRLTKKVTRAEIPSGQPDDLYGAEVFCLSCHRAHASQHNDAMRWNHAQKPQGCLECHTF